MKLKNLNENIYCVPSIRVTIFLIKKNGICSASSQINGDFNNLQSKKRKNCFIFKYNVIVLNMSFKSLTLGDPTNCL